MGATHCLAQKIVAQRFIDAVATALQEAVPCVKLLRLSELQQTGSLSHPLLSQTVAVVSQT